MKPPIEFRPRFNALNGDDPITVEDVFHQRHLDLIAATLNHKRAIKAAQMCRYRAKAKSAQP